MRSSTEPLLRSPRTRLSTHTSPNEYGVPSYYHVLLRVILALNLLILLAFTWLIHNAQVPLSPWFLLLLGPLVQVTTLMHVSVAVRGAGPWYARALGLLCLVSKKHFFS